MTLLKEPETLDQLALPPCEGSADQDPAVLCARLRELAHQAHQAVRGRTPRLRVESLRDRALRLRLNLEALRLGDLASYARALERTLNDELA